MTLLFITKLIYSSVVTCRIWMSNKPEFLLVISITSKANWLVYWLQQSDHRSSYRQPVNLWWVLLLASHPCFLWFVQLISQGGALPMTQIVSISSQITATWKDWRCHRWNPSHRSLPQLMGLKPFTGTFSQSPLSSRPDWKQGAKVTSSWRGNVTYITKADVVVTVFPQHPDVKAVFTEELAKAEDKVNDDEKCSFDISFDRILRKWFGDFMLRTTGKEWNSRGAYLGWKSSIITTNHSAPVDFCGHIGCRLFAIFLCPIWCCGVLLVPHLPWQDLQGPDHSFRFHCLGQVHSVLFDSTAQQTEMHLLYYDDQWTVPNIH